MKNYHDFPELKKIVEKLGLEPKDYNYTSDRDLQGMINHEKIKRQDNFKKKLYKGIEITREDLEKEIKVYGGLLTFRGENVLLYIKDNGFKSIVDIRNNPDEGKKFHIGWCKTLEKMDNKHRFDRYVTTIKDDGEFIIDTAEEKEFKAKLNVCKNCLDYLHYKGYDFKKHSPTQKKEAVKNFNIKKFFSEAEGIVRYLKIPERKAETTPIDIRGPEYTIIANQLKKEKNYTCEDCSVYLGCSKNRKYLHAHHINGRKYDNSRINLKILCVDCHLNKYHNGTHWMKVNANDIEECRKIKREQGKT